MKIFLIEKTIQILLTPLFVYIHKAHTPQEHQIRFQLCSEFLSLLPFRIGMLLRRIFYVRTLAGCGTDPVIRLGTVFVHPQAELGNNVLLGTRCVIGLASIGDGVMLGHHVSILSGRHHHTQGNAATGLQDGTLTRVYIGRNVWVGAGATVMADIGDGAIVGAGAVVVNAVPVGATVVGNPARTVKTAEVVM